eukprot:jgi/Mesvir1/24310/Mv10998-RA.1
MAPVNAKIGFIGSGQMAEALAKGFIAAKVANASQIYATDVVPVRRDVMAQMGITAFEDTADVVRNSDVVFVSVKPDNVPEVLQALRSSGLLTSRHVVVSICAGVTLQALETNMGDVPFVRVMPNYPCLVGQTAAGMALGTHAKPEHGAIVSTLLEAVGKVHIVKEKLLDAVTGLSGSGPAFVFAIIEAMADGGVYAGLPRDVATSLAAQTVLGSAQMVLQTGKHPGLLKDSICSPGGTTIEGMLALEKAGVRAGVMEAVIAAANKATALGKR